MTFDPLTATCADLQVLLETNQITSVEIIERCLSQIQKFDKAGKCLNAMIAVAPRHVLLTRAMKLDQERKNGKVRGALHGIPVILKDCIQTSHELGMPTTCGSWAFVAEKVKANAVLVDKLMEAGMIVLGKANLTEFGGLKATAMRPGWSSYGGQTISAYVESFDPNDGILGHSSPGGSSVGSAVAASAGYAPLTIGCDSCGSIMVPAVRAGLYSIKPTLGLVNSEGILGLSSYYDSAGPMGKSATDIELALDAMLDDKARHDLKKSLEEMNTDWKGMRLGFADPKQWSYWDSFCPQKEGTAEQMDKEYETAVEKLMAEGATVTYPIELPPPNITVDDVKPIGIIGFYNFAFEEIPKFIQNLDNPQIKNIEDLIKFNEDNSKFSMPEPYQNQNDLIQSARDNPGEEKIAHLKFEFRKIYREKVDKVFEEKNIDLIICPGDSPLSILSSATGYPIATVPLGTLEYNDRPLGLNIMAKAGAEADIIRFMKNWERMMPPRPIPKLLK